MKKGKKSPITELSCKKNVVCKERSCRFGDAIYVPVGCRACGNPAFPNCKSSCPMFDD